MVELRAIYLVVKSGVVRCYLICRFLPHTTSRQGSLYLARSLQKVSVDRCILVYAHTYRCPGILAVRTTALWEHNKKIMWSLWGLLSVRMRPDIQP